MADAIFLLGVAVACFVAYNIGGATTGPAFGPAVGADLISKTLAAGLMTVCFFAGAWTIGRRVVDTLGDDLVLNQAVFTLESSIVILFFIGGALLVGNLSGVPASTSMTAVGAIAGFALAVGELDLTVIWEIVIWWIVGPVIGFWISVMIGRYLYPSLDHRIAIDRTGGRLFLLRWWGPIPYPGLASNASR